MNGRPGPYMDSRLTPRRYWTADHISVYVARSKSENAAGQARQATLTPADWDDTLVLRLLE